VREIACQRGACERACVRSLWDHALIRMGARGVLEHQGAITTPSCSELNTTAPPCRPWENLLLHATDRVQPPRKPTFLYSVSNTLPSLDTWPLFLVTSSGLKVQSASVRLRAASARACGGAGLHEGAVGMG
jgi:hypothetical protein